MNQKGRTHPVTISNLSHFCSFTNKNGIKNPAIIPKNMIDRNIIETRNAKDSINMLQFSKIDSIYFIRPRGIK